MPAQPAGPTGPTSADVATEVSGLVTGLGILTFALFPVALPGLILFVVAPLALVAVVGLLLAAPLVLLVWLARTIRRSRSKRSTPGSRLARLASPRAESAPSPDGTPGYTH